MSFRSVFRVEMDFTEPYSEVQQKGMQEVSVQRQEIDKLLEKLDARKEMGPDGNYSSWSGVTSGVPQGSVLAHIMFQIYIHDMQEGLNSYIYLFADDAKLLRVIKSHTDCMELQRDIDKIHEWSKRWKLEFNAKKCHVR